MDNWGMNALAPIKYVDRWFGKYESPKVKEEWEKFKRELQLAWDHYQAKVDEIIERLKIDLKQWEDDQEKKLELIGEAFTKLEKESGKRKKVNSL